MGLRLLFVDDEPEILEINEKYFAKIGYEVNTALDAGQALVLFQKYAYDCAILDIRMDGTDGYDLCRRFRSITNVPIIFLTCLVQEDALIQGFSCGADDYLVKPYSLRELEARICARVHSWKITASPSPNTLRLDTVKKQAYIGLQNVGLTSNEFEILNFLASHRGQSFRQEVIYQHVWGEACCYNSHSVQTLILRIRRKLSLLSPGKEFIKTQWGKGYTFTDY